ncbi:hypothetical protein [Gallibacterium sp. ZY190522]
MKIKQRLRVNKKMVEGAIYYFGENCRGYLGLCKTRSIKDRAALLEKASRQRQAMADYVVLRNRIQRVLSADYVVLH